MTALRIAVTGGRGYDNWTAVVHALRQMPEDAILVHGAAPGADRQCAEWWDMKGRTDEPHPADWTAACRDTCTEGHRRTRPDGSDYCPAEGHYRNQRMVDSGLDLLIAFPGGNGTACAATGRPGTSASTLTSPVGQLALRVEPEGTGPAGQQESVAAAPPAVPLVVTVYGKPITQGSKTKNRYGAVYDDNAATLKPWREAVKTAGLDVMRDADRITGPVQVRCVFSFERPSAHYRTGRNAHLLRENASPFPANVRSGDIDKIQRSCFDALTDAGVWVDDSQVVKVEAEKVWTGTALALPIPGARIEITEMAAPSELVCADCHRAYTVWYADNDLWNAVMRPDGWTSEPFLCARCFLVRAEPWTEFARVTWPEVPSRRDRERAATS